MAVLFRANKIIAAGLAGVVVILALGCGVSSIGPIQDIQPVGSVPPLIITATFFTPTITLTPTRTSMPIPTNVPPTATRRPTRTPRPSATPTLTATRRSPTPTGGNPASPTSDELPAQTPDIPPTQILVSTPTLTPAGPPTRTPKPSATPIVPPAIPTSSDPNRLSILTMGACNTIDRGFIWGPPNVATVDGFEAVTLWLTDWAPSECKPDANNPARPWRSLTVAECAVYYYRPMILVLFPNRPFNGRVYYDDIATLIVHIESFENEMGLSHSKKIVMGPVSYDGGVIGSPNTVMALGARVVNLPDIILKTRDATGFMAASDNVHLIPSIYFFGIVNTVVLKAVVGTNTVYTIEMSEIPPYAGE